MSHGIKIYNNANAVKFSSENQTIRSIFSFLVEKDSSGSIVVSNYDSSKGFVSINVAGNFEVVIDYNFDNSSKVFSWNSSGGAAVVSFFNIK